MNTIFTNCKNSKTSDPNKLLLYLTDTKYSRRKDKRTALSNLSIYYTWKKYKTLHIRTINLKFQVHHGIKNLNYLMNTIVYWAFQIIFEYI